MADQKRKTTVGKTTPEYRERQIQLLVNTSLGFKASSDVEKAASRVESVNIEVGGVPLICQVCKIGNSRAVKVLLNHGADVGAITSDLRQTPLHLACIQSATQAINALIEAGADVQARDVNGEQPIHMAAAMPSVFIIRQLIKAGADIQATAAGSGKTPLHFCAQRKGSSYRVAEFLLRAGADPMARDHDGKTPLDCCPELRETEATRALLRAAKAKIEVSKIADRYRGPSANA